MVVEQERGKVKFFLSLELWVELLWVGFLDFVKYTANYLSIKAWFNAEHLWTKKPISLLCHASGFYRLACGECNEEHPTNIDGNCSEIFHRPVQWRCQGHGKDKTNLSTQASKSFGPTGSFVEWVYPSVQIICFHVCLQEFQNEWCGEMVQPLKKTLPCNLIKHILKTAKPTITTNQLNRDLRSQVTGVLQSNAGSSSSMGFFSLAYQWDQPPNSWNLPISLPYFCCDKVLVMSLLHPPKKNQVNNPLSFAKSFDSSK